MSDANANEWMVYPLMDERPEVTVCEPRYVERRVSVRVARAQEGGVNP